MFYSLLARLPLGSVRMSPARQTTSRLALARQPLCLDLITDQRQHGNAGSTP
jgi:hypothetical protein